MMQAENVFVCKVLFFRDSDRDRTIIEECAGKRNFSSHCIFQALRLAYQPLNIHSISILC